MGYMITTVDNPYDPRSEFGAWNAWDIKEGYHTCSYLARVARVAEDMPEIIQDKHIELAIDEIIKIHNGGLYTKLWVNTQLEPSKPSETP